MPRVVLVDRADRVIGTADKMQAHREGALHRAFSVFVFRPDGSMLLQRRARSKYHSGGLWSNTCCSHPGPGEPLESATHRRLREEMGFDCELHRAFAFVYRAQLDRGLYEHEYDHVFIGRCDAVPDPDPREVGAWRDVHLDELAREIAVDPGRFTVWFLIALSRFLADDLSPHAAPARSRGPSSLLEVRCSSF
jgi:isopentenyl-diphosphate Delta-isomerase